MRWGRPRSRRLTAARPWRPWRRLPGRRIVIAAVLVGVAAGVLLGIDRAGLPPDAIPFSGLFRPDPPAATVRPQGAEATFVGRATVLDGDTIEVRGRRIRLHGIDAPENDQVCERDGRPWRCGLDATQALRRHLGARTVTCRELDIDRFGRSVARCFADGEDVNAWLVRNGWAVAYRRYSEAYVRDEAEARAARRGIWAGRFEMPESYRQTSR